MLTVEVLWLPAGSALRTAMVCTPSAAADRSAVKEVPHDVYGPPSTEQLAVDGVGASWIAQVGVGSLPGLAGGAVMVGAAGASRSST